jgi:RNA polymerase sigma factor (TIGR02999 family)
MVGLSETDRFPSLAVPMPETSSQEVTRLLEDWCGGRSGALDQLMPIVYRELCRIARGCMNGENPGNTLQTTALVNEAYLQLVEFSGVDLQSRAHFYAVCAKVMRRILIDAARARRALKRGGGMADLAIKDDLIAANGQSIDVVALDQALNRLAALDERKSHVVECRFFGGMSVEETAEVLRVSQETVLRDWRLARVWLFRTLGEEGRHAS